MAEFLSPSTLIFLFLLTDCYAINSDILSTGHDILRSSKHADDVFNGIDDVWEFLFAHYPSYVGDQLNPDGMQTLLNVPHYSPTDCYTSSIADSVITPGNECSPLVKKSVSIAMSSRERINQMNKHVENIDAMYRTVFTTNFRDPSKPFHLTDSLYNFIVDGCRNKSTCIFHEIAGKHISEPDARRIRTSFAINGEIYYAYLIIVFHFLKGYAAEMYRSDYLSNKTEPTRAKELSIAKFLMHTHKISQLAISAIKDAPRYIVREEVTAKDFQSDSPYIQLQWYIGLIIVNEINLSVSGVCGKGCDYYRFLEMIFQKRGLVPQGARNVCLGTMTQCSHQPLGHISPAIHHSKRYEGFQLQNGSTYGFVDSFIANMDQNTIAPYHTRWDFIPYCDTCQCVCDDRDNPETIRAFSLKAVTSNIKENMAITGLKLVERNGIIYIRIRQGKLTDINRVNSSEWVPGDTIDKETASVNDLFTLRFPSHNSVNLDTISVEDEFVQQHILHNDVNYFFFPNHQYLLTGIKFDSYHDSLRLGIRLSAWNAKSKRISSRNWNNWIFNENPLNKKELILEEPDVSSKTNDNVEFMSEDYYVKFRTTDTVKDFGQTTVPFLDSRPVITDPLMPLSGAGLFFKGKKGYGGVIGLKLVSIDFSNFIVTELE